MVDRESTPASRPVRVFVDAELASHIVRLRRLDRRSFTGMVNILLREAITARSEHH